MKTPPLHREQLRILRVACGLNSDGTGHPTRSYFVCIKDSPVHTTATQLVALGLMWKNTWKNGPRDVFYVYPAAVELAKASTGKVAA